MRAWHWLVLGGVACGLGCAAPVGDPIPPHESFQLAAKELAEYRPIHVALPDGYHAGQRRYPVLYLLDGGVHEDFPHLVQTVLELTQAGKIAPCLVVGISNTMRRFNLTGPTAVASDREVAPIVGGAPQFRRFVATELIPEVERRYRCTGQRALVGESLAGLFVVETLLLQPELFERYLAMSPSLWWNGASLVANARRHLAALPDGERGFWFTTANEADIAPHCDRLAEVLQQVAKPQLRWVYAPRKDLEHHTILRGTKADAFAAMLWQH